MWASEGKLNMKNKNNYYYFFCTFLRTCPNLQYNRPKSSSSWQLKFCQAISICVNIEHPYLTVSNGSKVINFLPVQFLDVACQTGV